MIPRSYFAKVYPFEAETGLNFVKFSIKTTIRLHDNDPVVNVIREMADAVLGITHKKKVLSQSDLQS